MTTRDPTRRPTHPGAILREDVLPAIGITQGEFAARLGVSRIAVTTLIHEHKKLTPDMAFRLERLLGTKAEVWLGMQQALDLFETRQDSRRFNKITRLEAATG